MSAPRPPGLLSVEEARDAVLAVAEPVGTETIAPADALGRSRPRPSMAASVSLPPWANSAMDGYAIRAADTAGATEAAPVELRVIGDVAGRRRARCDGRARARPSGSRPGAPVPAGADAVVPVEATTPLDAAGGRGPRGRDATGPLPAACLVHEPVEPGGSVRGAGSDLEAGATSSRPGAAMTAGRGRARRRRRRRTASSVHRRPRVAVLATGDEVRGAGRAARPGRDPRRQRPGPRAPW